MSVELECYNDFNVNQLGLHIFIWINLTNILNETNAEEYIFKDLYKTLEACIKLQLCIYFFGLRIKSVSMNTRQVSDYLEGRKRPVRGRDQYIQCHLKVYLNCFMSLAKF